MCAFMSNGGGDESSSVLQSLAGSKVCYFTEGLDANRFICLLCFDSSGWTLPLTYGIRMCKALHLVVREIVFEAMIYVCH